MGRVERNKHLSQPAGHTSFNGAQDAAGLLSYKCTLLARVEPFILQNPQVLLCKAALNGSFSQSVLIPGIALAQVQHLALALVECHEVHISLLFK